VRVRTPGVLALVAALLVASACSGSVRRDEIRSAEGTITGLTVAGEAGSAPTVRMAIPLKVPSTRTDVVVAGTGAPIQLDQLFVLQLSLYDARTGRLALSTYRDGVPPVVAKTTDDTLFPALSRALVGVRRGSRVVLALTPSDAYLGGATPPSGVLATDPVVVVADVVAVPPVTVAEHASGKAHPATGGGPQVRYAGSEPVSIDFAGAGEPGQVTTIPLIDGSGPPVRDHSLVTVDLLGQVWGGRAPFADTYFKEPVLVPIGAEGSVPTWDQALVGVPQGSRVLVVGPAGPPGVAVTRGIGEDVTTAWVVDVLGVS
jgi:peptidylprolyl isomerase